MADNYVTGYRFGQTYFQLSCAPFLFSRGIWMTVRGGLTLRCRQYELAVFRR